MDKLIEKKRFTKKRIITYLIMLSVLIIFLNLLLKPYQSSAKVNNQFIDIRTITEGNFLDFITFTGTLHPERTIVIDAMEGGRIEEIFVNEGTFLNKDDVILRLSNTNLQMSMMNRESELADQMNNLRNTRLLMEQNRLSLYGQLYDSEHLLNQRRREYNQRRELYDKNLISRNEYLIAQEDYYLMQKKTALVKQNIVQDSLFRHIQLEQLNDSVKRLEENLKIIRDKMDGLTIKAPVSGQLSFLNAEIGESKFSGERLGSINVLGNFKLQANISEFYLNRVQIGLSGTAESDRRSYPVRISRIHPEVKSGSFSVELVFDNTEQASFRIGQSFVIRLELGGERNAILLPKGGFYRNTGGQWIFVVTENGERAYKRTIRLGMQNPEYYEVIDGLYPGDRVIISNYDNFENADQLKIIKE